MTYYDAAMRTLPQSLFKQSGNAWVDIAGGVAMSANPIKASAICTGNINSMYFSGTHVYFSSSLFKAGQEKKSFSLEAWFNPLNATQIGIIAHSAKQDGLWYSGTSINMTIIATSGSLTASWPVPNNRASYHVVGVYSRSKVSLYINGELVSSIDVPTGTLFTTEPSTNLYIGQGSGALAVIDGVSTYPRALTQEEIENHYVEGVQTEDMLSVAPAIYGATVTDVIADFTEGVSFDFADGFITSCSIRDGIMTPLNNESNVSIAGQWQGSIPLSNVMDTGTIPMARIDWVGAGTYTVETSVNNGTSWSAATNGKNVTGVLWLDGTNLNLMVRVTFAGGVSNDTSNISNLTITFIKSNLISDTGRPISWTGAVSPALSEFTITRREEIAAMSLLGGSVTLGPDKDSLTTGSVELWALLTNVSTTILSASGVTVSIDASNNISFAASQVYVDGTLVTSGSALTKGWHHLVIVPTTPIPAATNISIPMNGSVGLIGYSDTIPSAATISNLYLSYVTGLAAQAADSGLVTVTEFTITLFDNVRAIVSAG